MDTTLIIVLAVIASSYIGFGALFFYCVRSMSISPLEQFKLLRDVISVVSLFIQKQYPNEHPEHKKSLARQLIKRMLRERLKGPVTLDVLIDASQTDEDTRLLASQEPTQQVPVPQPPTQNTPPNGIRQRAVFHKTGGLVPL